MDRVMLIDSKNFAWRANVLFKPKKQIEGYEDDKKEEPAKATPPENVVIYNYFRNLRALLEPFAPHKVIDVRDGHPTFRYELLPSYKENRLVKTAAKEPTKADLSKAEAKARFDLAYPEIRRLMKFLPVCTAVHPNYEADDVIGSLVEDLKDEDVIVVSGDSDLIQLAQKGYANLRLYHPIKKTMQTPPAYSYLAWKCLAGDKTDVIPSLMSNAKAEKLASDPEALKKWLEIEENRANFAIQRQLIELAQVPLDEVEFETNTADWDRLKLEFEQLEFATIVAPDYWARFRSTFNTIRF
jgi:5'-3' exonuclease